MAVECKAFHNISKHLPLHDLFKVRARPQEDKAVFPLHLTRYWPRACASTSLNLLFRILYLLD